MAPRPPWISPGNCVCRAAGDPDHNSRATSRPPRVPVLARRSVRRGVRRPQDPYLLPATLSRRRSGHQQQGRGCLLLCSSARLLPVVICKIRPFSSILSIFCSFSTKLGFFRGRNFHLQNVTLRLEDICCPVVTIVRRGGHCGQHRCSLLGTSRPKIRTLSQKERCMMGMQEK